MNVELECVWTKVTLGTSQTAVGLGSNLAEGMLCLSVFILCLCAVL
jgi:hypothetical protein